MGVSTVGFRMEEHQGGGDSCQLGELAQCERLADSTGGPPLTKQSLQ